VQHSKSITCIEIIEGNILTTSLDGSLKIWNFTDKGLVLINSHTVDDSILSMAFVKSQNILVLGLKNGSMTAFNSQWLQGKINVVDGASIVGLEVLELEELLFAVCWNGQVFS